MSEKKRICLLGFTQDAEHKIKNIIQKNDTAHTFEWVAANDKNLDGVVINAGFLEAPQVKKYMGMISCPVVCAHANEEGATSAAQQQLHSIAWDKDNSDISIWLAVLTKQDPQEPVRAKTLEMPAVVPASTPLQANNKPVARPLGKEDLKCDILKKIRRGDNIVLQADYEDNSTWVKPAEGLVYINYHREKVPGYDLWQWAEVDNVAIPATARQLKIDVWLFETLWQSHLDGIDHINKSAHFRLIRWPQPLGRNGRTEALRLVACAQSYPVDIKTLHEKTNYSLEQIHRFLFASVSAGHMEEVLGQFKVSVPQRPQMNEKEKQEKRSLLQRFRAKLGL